ncbi:Thioesterase/thiol ester dehydrase-isomerase, partial [Neoconidiobolus thromboides FSU 785]
TRSMDAVHFMSPIKVGSIIIFKGQINRSWKTSIEVQVTVEVDDLNGLGCSSLLTFVLVNGPRDENNVLRLPKLYPETSFQTQLYEQAEVRRNKRMQLRKTAKYSQELENFRSYLLSSTAKASSTYAESAHTILPSQANNIDTLFGGQIMNWMESCASVSATRHAKGVVMSASSDAIQFVKPSRVGDIIILRSLVTKVFNKSMEVYVMVTKLEPGSSVEEFTNDGFFTFVTMQHGSNHQLNKLQPLVPVSPEEQAIAASADLRKAER